MEGSATNEPQANGGTPTSPPTTRVIVVLEGTAAMAGSWITFGRKWLYAMLKNLDQEGKSAPPQGQPGVVPKFQYCVVVYGTNDPTTPAPVMSSDWTCSTTEVQAMVDAVQFVGGVGSKGTCLAQALAEAINLSKCPYPGGTKPAAAGVYVCVCVLLHELAWASFFKTWGWDGPCLQSPAL